MGEKIAVHVKWDWDGTNGERITLENKPEAAIVSELRSTFAKNRHWEKIIDSSKLIVFENGDDAKALSWDRKLQHLEQSLDRPLLIEIPNDLQEQITAAAAGEAAEKVNQLDQEKRELPQQVNAAEIDVSCCKLSQDFLERYKLTSYVNAAQTCAGKEEFRALLNALSNHEEVEKLQTGSHEDGEDASPGFSCIIAPSGTGKSQLAATAAQTDEWNVAYFYTGAAGSDDAQKFYKPHIALRNSLFQALRDFKSKLGEDIGAWTISHTEFGHSLFQLLSKCLFPKERIEPENTATLSFLRGRIKNGSKKPLMFLDEMPSSQSSTRGFDSVILLRNVLRAAGVSPILMSTHTGSMIAIKGGSDSRRDSKVWCRVFVNLPNYQPPDPKTLQNNPWLVETERPLVAAMMVYNINEKKNISGIVDQVQQKIQEVKEQAWLDDPSLQLCQLFRTKESTRTKESAHICDTYKHRIVGYHFGRINPDSDSTIPWTVDREASKTWVQGQVVQFVDPEKEPVLFLALTTWKRAHLWNDVFQNSSRFFTLMSDKNNKRRRLSIRGAYEASSFLFTKQVGTDNDSAKKLDGDDLEVLALAAITLSSLQSDDGIFQRVRIAPFLANIFHFMSTQPIDHGSMSKTEDCIRKLLESTPFCGIEIPACPCYGSSFGEPFKLDVSRHGKLIRPADKEGRDGYMECNGSTVLHVECKNLMKGLSTEVFKKVVSRMRDACQLSLLFTSDINGLLEAPDAFVNFTEKQLGLEQHDVCFLVLDHNKDKPYWLSIQKNKLTLEPKEGSRFLMVMVATGAVASTRKM